MSMFCSTNSSATRLFLLASLILATAAEVLAGEHSSLQAAPEPAGEWPGWRGPTRDGFVGADTPAWPSDISAERLGLAWSIGLGPSYSGPVLSGGRLFTTETEGETDEVVRAFDRATGEEIWQTRWPGAIKVPFFADRNGSWIRSTPACDGETLFVGGIRDRLMALDAATGGVRWSIDFPARTGSAVPDFGFVSSPMIVGETLYVQAGGAFHKLDKSDGSVIWKTLSDGGGMYNAAFSSPVMSGIGGSPLLLVQTRNDLCGVVPETGEVVWKQFIKSFRGMNILTPTEFEGGVFTSNYRGKTYLFRPVPDESGAMTVREEWKGKAQGYMSSPVVIDGHAYLHLQNRRLACINLRTGEEAWRTSESFGDYWSMAAQGNRILALDQDGELLLIEADPSKPVIRDRRRISDQETWAHIAVAGNQVAIRELNAISVYEWR